MGKVLRLVWENQLQRGTGSQDLRAVTDLLCNVLGWLLVQETFQAVETSERGSKVMKSWRRAHLSLAALPCSGTLNVAGAADVATQHRDWLER